jgi:Putative zinc-finger
MDHTAVVREKMTEKYLLQELEPEVRDEFEEHYFDCPECTLDVRAGSQFVEESKVVLAEEAEPVPVRAISGPRSGRQPVRQPARQPWFAWLRPAFAAPALALLLAVAGYQNLVTYPTLRAELNQPQVLPAAVSVNVGTYGGSDTPTIVPAGRGLLLYVRITPDGSYARYMVELYSPAGKSEGSISIPAPVGPSVVPVTMPGATREAGTYTTAVRGVTSSGETKDLGSTSFQLQIQR